MLTAYLELRGAAGESPEMQKEIEQMIREMQRLDPGKFTGNPELVERIRAQFLPQLEQLEISRYAFWPGNQTSMSCVLRAAKPMSPVESTIVR